jgi:hypothetical protein
MRYSCSKARFEGWKQPDTGQPENEPRLISESWRGLLISGSSHRTDIFNHRNSPVGDRAMFGTETKAPIVMCPGCDEVMTAMVRNPDAFSHGLVDVTYVCETCGSHTIRTIKSDHKGLL